MAAGWAAKSMPTLLEVSAALKNLRRPWPHRWPGLPLVFERCCHQLALRHDRAGSRTQALLTYARAVVEHVEHDGLSRFARGGEPAYHNRLHIADTLVCMTFLLQASRLLKVPGSDEATHQAMALAIMAGHDFLHPGGSNASPAEFEVRAVQDLQPFMARAALAQEDRETLAYCILATDPSRVKSFHHQIASQPFDLSHPDCMAVLVQESDILGSTLPQTQVGLTRALSQEWSAKQPDAAQALLRPKNRLLFLEHAALFSSPAALVLGLDRVKGRQMTQIRGQLALETDA